MRDVTEITDDTHPIFDQIADFEEDLAVEAYLDELCVGFYEFGFGYKPVVPNDLRHAEFTLVGTVSGIGANLNSKHAGIGLISTIAGSLSAAPALLALRAGFPDNLLTELLETNQVGLADLKLSMPGRNGNDDVFIDIAGKTWTDSMINLKMCELVASSPALSKEARSALSTNSLLSTQALTLSTLSNKMLWISTRLDEQLKCHNLTNLNVLDPLVVLDYHFPTTNLYGLLQATGALHPTVIQNKYFRSRFWDGMLMQAFKNDEIACDFLHQCVKDPRISPLVSRALAHTLVADSPDLESDDTDRLRALITRLIEAGVSPHFSKSIVTDLNLAPPPEYDDLDESVYETLSDSGSALVQLTKEVMHLEPHDIGLAEFQAMINLTKHEFDHGDASDVDINEVIQFLLKALGAYTDDLPRLEVNDNSYNTFHEIAYRGATSLLMDLPKEKVDYSALKHLKIHQVLMLADAGLDATKLPKMELNHYGKYFTRELGV